MYRYVAVYKGETLEEAIANYAHGEYGSETLKIALSCTNIQKDDTIVKCKIASIMTPIVEKDCILLINENIANHEDLSSVKIIEPLKSYTIEEAEKKVFNDSKR